MEVNNSDFSRNRNSKGSALLIDGNMRFQKMKVSFYQVVIDENQAASHGAGIVIGSNIWTILFTVNELKCLSNSAICIFKFLYFIF